MIHASIIDLFLPITEEEKRILDANGQVDVSIYGNWPYVVNDMQKIFRDDGPIHVRKHTRFGYFPPHRHNYIEIVYMCRGMTTQILNGNRIELKQGQLLFLSPSTEQEILPAGETDIAINLLVQKEFFQSDVFLSQTRNNTITTFLASVLFDPDESGYMIFDTDGIRSVENLLENVIMNILDNKPMRNSILQSTFSLLFMELASQKTDKIHSEGPNVRRMIEIFRYIETSFATATLPEIAQRLHCSPSFLSHYIKNRTGYSFSTLLHRKRIQVAERQLRCTDKKIADIIRECGYETTGYFYKTFREKYGESPNAFRRKSYDKEEER